MAYDRVKKRLAAGQIIVLDGATGTELQRRGAPMDPAAWCGPAMLHADRLLTEIHADYIEAGADVITANTFASSRLMLSGAGLAERTDEINRRAVAAALRARDAHERGAQVLVAGSLSHMMPMAERAANVDPRTAPSDSAVGHADRGRLQRAATNPGICGALIIIGLLTRLAAIPLIIIMIVAIVSTEVPVLLGHDFWLFHVQKLPRYGFWSMAHEARLDFVILLGSIYLLIEGAGKWSLAAIVDRHTVDALHVTKH
jgi:hypothetical protein